jgi:DNA-binding transcriptional ArsR family regulator
VFHIENVKKNFKLIEQQAELLKAISHPIRLCIVNGLMSDKGCNVSKIKGCLGVPQSTVSQHLGKLKSAGIVEGRRNGTQVNYYVVNEQIKEIVDCLNIER